MLAFHALKRLVARVKLVRIEEQEEMLNTPDKRLALQAYEQVLDMIMSGEAKPGTLINERQLALLLKMSRTPVRDALLMLESEGLLVRQGTRGLQVKQMNVEDFMEALQIRLLLEPVAARIAAGRVSAAAITEIVALLESIIAEYEAGETAVDRAKVRSVDNRLHDLIGDAVGNKQMSAIIRSMRRQTQIFDLKSIPERLQDTCREHLDIMRAIGTGNETDAFDAMTVHLNHVRQSIIARLTGS